MAFPLRLHQRLLRDVAEMQTDPYPKIKLHMDNSLTQACLILSPERQRPLHLTMVFDGYPRVAPEVAIQSKVRHPNVFGNYICASILKTPEDYTPAYTLKSIAIQLLSFFSSETLEQDDGRQKVDLERYRQARRNERSTSSFHCVVCGFDERAAMLSRENSSNSSGGGRKHAKIYKHCESKGMELDKTANAIIPVSKSASATLDLGQRFLALPDEMLLDIFSYLSDEDLWAFATVFPVTNEILNSYDFIRLRELQCFCLKESFMKVKLGVGVHVHCRGREGTFESEFDLISQEAFLDYAIRTSVQGLPFEHWLPLPISRRHWRSVRSDVSGSLQGLAHAANLKDVSDVHVIYHFMNDVVVKFSQEAEKCFDFDLQSSLTYASTKAVESFFALFHLLLCLASEDAAIVRSANATIDSFLEGRTSKSFCPNLGHLLVAALVSNAGLTEQLRIAVIKEAVLRNVVWMLDPTGANMPELAYLEPSAISDYRLQRSFQASKTSYHLLMFLTLFCRIARGKKISLADLCDRIFDTHSAPSRGSAESIANEIRRIKDVESFPLFFTAMGVKDMPSKENFTAFLRRMVMMSEEMGYSRMPMTQGEALALRKMNEPKVEVATGVVHGLVTMKITTASFFPNGATRRGGGPGRKDSDGRRGRRY